MSIDSRIDSFVKSTGVVPLDARRLRDDEAQAHAAAWIQRVLGKGLAGEYVAAYAHANSWWTFCFARRLRRESPHSRAEVWRVEAYDSMGHAWRGLFLYSPDSDRWQPFPAEPMGTTSEANDSSPPDDQAVAAPIVLIECDEGVGSSPLKFSSVCSAVRGLLLSRP